MFLLFANMATRKFKTMDVAGILFDGIVLIYIVRPRLESSSISPQNFPEPVLWVQYTSKESWRGSWGEGILGTLESDKSGFKSWLHLQVPNLCDQKFHVCKMGPLVSA